MTQSGTSETVTTHLLTAVLPQTPQPTRDRGKEATAASVLTIWCHWVVEKKVSCSLLLRNLEGHRGAAQQSPVLGGGVWHTLPMVPASWGPPLDMVLPGVLTSAVCWS